MEISKEKFEELCKATHDAAKLMKEVNDGSAEQKELVAKLSENLTNLTTNTETKLDEIKAEVVALKDEGEAEGKSVYERIVEEGFAPVELMATYGYSNPFERKMYRPTTEWSRDKGWYRDSEYEVPKHIMQLHDAAYLYGSYKVVKMGMNPAEVPEVLSKEIQKSKAYKMFMLEVDCNTDLRKALAVATSSEGAEWVMTGFSATMIDDVRLALKVAAMFSRITIPLGVGSFTVPIQGSRREAYLLGESTSDSPTKIPAVTPPTANITFTAKKHGLRMVFSDEFDEDSVISVMPLVQRELVAAEADAEEIACINGDDASTHQDSDITASNDIRKSWDGLRLHAGGSSGQAAVDLNTLSLDNIRSIEKKMGRFGINPTERFFAMSMSAYIEATKMDELLTLNLLGPQATVLTGQLGQLDGSPVIVSEHIRQDLNATGVYDGSTTTQTIILLVNRPAFWFGDKPGGIKVETARDIEVGQTVAVASRRLDFKQAITPGTEGEETVGLGYNITS